MPPVYAYDPLAPAKELNRLCDAAEQAMGGVVADGAPGSLLRRERQTLTGLPEGGSTARKALLEKLAGDIAIMTAHILVLGRGVADCLEVAMVGSGLKMPAAASVVRSQAEAAGTVAWLLDDEVGAASRCRRYLSWRFNDLRSQRYVFGDSPGLAGPIAQAEADLIALTRNARWQARPYTESGGHHENASLLLDDGGVERFPKLSELALLVAGSESFYPLMSAASHADRWALHVSIDHSSKRDDDAAHVLVPGFGAPPSLLLRAATVSAANPVAAYLGWHGADALRERLHERAKRCMEIARMINDAPQPPVE